MKPRPAVLLAVIIGFAPAALASAQFVLFPVAAEPGNGPRGICSGPDGNVWFTVANRVGRMTPSGALVEFELPIANSRPGDIVTGSDGDLWFLEENARMVGRISPTGSITEYPIPAANAAPRQIVVGADTAIWFSDFIRRSIWRMDSPGSFTEYPTSAESYGLAAGSDGNLWFTTFFGLPRSIGRLTPSGAVTLFPRPSSSFGWRCGLGPDGNVWYTTARAFGRVTPSGAITEFPVMSDRGHVPTAVASGSDGNLWMPVDESFQCIPPCTPPEEKDGILRVSTTGFQTRYELAADLQILDGSTITAGPGGSMWFTALHGLVRFFPADLAGGTPSVQVPTMGDVARVALVGLLTLAGLAFLRR